MEPLIYIPPLDRETENRVMKAHLMRGLLYWLDSPRNSPVVPNTFLYRTGLQSRIPFWQKTPPLEIQPHMVGTVALYMGLLQCAKPWEDYAQSLDTGRLFQKTNAIARIHCKTFAEYEVWLATAYAYQFTVKTYPTLQERYSAMTTADQSKIPSDIMNKLQSNLADLEKTLLAKDPMMPQHLRQIHSTIIAYPESVHLLTDDQISKMIDAAEDITKQKIVSEAAKKATGTKKKKESFDISEL